MGLSGLEPLTSRLSGARSNHLSYRPTILDRPGGAQGTGPEPSSAELQREEKNSARVEVAKRSTDLGIEQTKSRLHARRTWRSDAHELFDTP